MFSQSGRDRLRLVDELVMEAHIIPNDGFIRRIDFRYFHLLFFFRIFFSRFFRQSFPVYHFVAILSEFHFEFARYLGSVPSFPHFSAAYVWPSTQNFDPEPPTPRAQFIPYLRH